jgi:hypothetical protein
MILVPGIYDDVQKVGLTEDSLYKNIDFDVGEFKKYTGVKKLLHKEDKVRYSRSLCSVQFISRVSYTIILG